MDGAFALNVEQNSSTSSISWNVRSVRFDIKHNDSVRFWNEVEVGNMTRSRMRAWTCTDSESLK